jgi:CMP-N,N'-diacetyllegionaminic acid synthase
MFDGKRILAIIPARGGSKGLPGKNIRKLGGKPLLAWSIETARASSYIDTICVSTDCEDIARIARTCGAETPFLRPQELAGDNAKITDTLQHVISEYNKAGDCFDLLLLLQPTSPLRSSCDIDSAIELFKTKNAQAIVSVCEAEHHPWLSNTLPGNDNMVTFLRPEVTSSNRQSYPPFYRLNGAIYLMDILYFVEHHSYYGSNTYAYHMPVERSIDIDSANDFLLAEFLVSQNS